MSKAYRRQKNEKTKALLYLTQRLEVVWNQLVEMEKMPSQHLVVHISKLAEDVQQTLKKVNAMDIPEVKERGLDFLDHVLIEGVKKRILEDSKVPADVKRKLKGTLFQR